ncbi:hypothetical protein P886_4183 [Alteromonadaceae bacterium 2753L.S.0a.02]|nr:hypothetical protein P886_4183 [Alteromonadaceae bacterium 2753L.S.0a.02]
MSDCKDVDEIKRQHSEPQEGLVPLECDTDKYSHHIDNFDLSEQEKIECMKMYWNLMISFVELGFAVDSIGILASQSQDGKDGVLAIPPAIEGEFSRVKETSNDE